MKKSTLFIFIANLLLMASYWPMVFQPESYRYVMWFSDPIFILSFLAQFVLIQVGLKQTDPTFLYLLLILISCVGLQLKKKWAKNVVLVTQVFRFYWILGIMFLSLAMQFFGRMTLSVRLILLAETFGFLFILALPSILIWVILTRPLIKQEFH